MRITLNDGRQMTGKMLAFDKVSELRSIRGWYRILKQEQHMNLVLADTEEFRRVKRKAGKGTQTAPGSAPAPLVESEEKRTLGLTIVRGTNIISCSVDGPPPAEPSARLGTAGPGGAPATMTAGSGISRPAGRGLPVGLSGPAAGVGGPPPPGNFGGFPPAGFPGAAPPGFPGRGAPPGAPREYSPLNSTLPEADDSGLLAGFAPPPGFAPRKAPHDTVSSKSLLLTCGI